MQTNNHGHKQQLECERTQRIPLVKADGRFQQSVPWCVKAMSIEIVHRTRVDLVVWCMIRLPAREVEAARATAVAEARAQRLWRSNIARQALTCERRRELLSLVPIQPESQIRSGIKRVNFFPTFTTLYKVKCTTCVALRSGFGIAP